MPQNFSFQVTTLMSTADISRLDGTFQAKNTQYKISREETHDDNIQYFYIK
jgi:hypothetical protein